MFDKLNKIDIAVLNGKVLIPGDEYSTYRTYSTNSTKFSIKERRHYY